MQSVITTELMDTKSNETIKWHSDLPREKLFIMDGAAPIYQIFAMIYCLYSDTFYFYSDSGGAWSIGGKRTLRLNVPMAPILSPC